MLSTVVLPAPFGPIIEKTWPASTSRLTFVTAWTPPNDFETSRISTCALIGRRGPRRPPPRPEDALPRGSEPPESIARAKPALETRRPLVPCRLVTRDRRGLASGPPDAPPGL